MYFVSGKEFGLTDFVNPKDHEKPIQQVCMITVNFSFNVYVTALGFYSVFSW